ncbi:lipoprotein [Xenorhabdus miraniensis]|uniref:Lipoprotein n=1 Tax=Xenorhabdus miraniensis TaxID=351674 RepID=A0A2D0JJY6_9GAMM|nr:lipoprotein [Xenorhabdus miraniensis]PHM46626.1 hypothetical protein Xmir_04064 [Xenorhabdus miraniensis]
MKRLVVGLTAALVLSGCAVPSKEKKPLPKLTVENQRCYSDSECRSMWANVPEKLELITRVRVDTVSDIYIATYSPSGNRFLGGSAKIVPVNNREKEISPSFSCQRNMDEYSCQKLTILATNAFNEGMKGIKKAFSADGK